MMKILLIDIGTSFEDLCIAGDSQRKFLYFVGEAQFYYVDLSNGISSSVAYQGPDTNKYHEIGGCI